MQIYDKGKARIKKYIEDEKPEFVSLALDGWSIHHHGYIYMGAIASKNFHKNVKFDTSVYKDFF